MRPATLPVLLVLALLAVPLVERTFSPSSVVKSNEKRVGGVGSVTVRATPRIASASTVVAPGVATAATVVAPGVAAATMARGPSSSLELVTVLPPPPGQPPARPLTRAEAVAAVIRSPAYQETVPPVARLYLAAFGRYGDYEGLNYYTGVRESGLTLAEIAEEFAHSREFDMRYGSLGNEEFVRQLFVNVLGDARQADVRAYWVGELEAGRMTRGQVIVDLSESGAFRERSANRVLVSAAYAELFQRTPEPGAFAHWVGLLDQGYSRRSFIDRLLSGR